MRNNLITKRGFTLSEVLITLGIIGVIAALTLPRLISSYEKSQYTSSLQKAYSQMSQVLQRMALDNSGDIKSLFGGTAAAGNAISSYYHVVKNCKTSVGEGCFAPFNQNYDGSSGSADTDYDNSNGYYKFITTDGTSLIVYSYNNNCGTNRGFAAAPDSPTYNSTCGLVYIDVNGLKEPNNYGRDVFLYYITSNKAPMLYPAGGFYYSSSNTGTLTDGGDGYWNYQGTGNKCGLGGKYGLPCAGRIMNKGWEMDY